MNRNEMRVLAPNQVREFPIHCPWKLHPQNLPNGEDANLERDSPERREISLKEFSFSLLRASSVSVFSQFGNSQSTGRRVIWAMVLIIGLVGCSREIYRFFTIYFQYPVMVNLIVENNWEIDFPAVTVCNLNRIKLGVLEDEENCAKFGVTAELCKKLMKSGRVRKIITKEVSNGVTLGSCLRHSRGTYTERKKSMQDFLDLFIEMDVEAREKYGHQVEEFVQSCSFDGEKCDKRNFTLFQSLQYGNCYIFNRKTEKRNVTTTISIGSNSGLHLDLYLEPNEYGKITSDVGARVVIHHSNSEPNPDDHGFDISPGIQTSVAVQKTSIRRLPAPFKDRCHPYDKGSGSLPRSQEDCFRQCVQKANLINCGCTDPTVNAEPKEQPCSLNSEKEVCCLEEVTQNISESASFCDCPLPCMTVEYEMTTSFALWPSELYFEVLPQVQVYNRTEKKTQVVRTQQETSDETLNRMTGNRNNASRSRHKYRRESPPRGNESFVQTGTTLLPEDDNSMATDKVDEKRTHKVPKRLTFSETRNQRAKLKVFYKTLEHKCYSQQPVFQESELFSQLGGQLGLWLGVSFVALFECIESFVLLICFLLRRRVLNQSRSLSV